MKNPIFLFLSACLILTSINSCDYLGSYERGDGDIITANRSLSSFNKINIAGNFEVILEKSDREGIDINADSNLEPLIETKVRGDELTIDSQKKLISRQRISLTVHYKELNEIDVSGATLLKNDELLETNDLRLNLSGAGVINLQLKAGSLDADLSGAGLVKLNGYAGKCTFEMSGAGGLEAYGLETDDCTINVSGVGGAKINARNKLVANIQGVGGIQYIGNPAKIEKHVSGVGSISPGHDYSDRSDDH
jgi:hypothetical protein